MLLRFAGAFSGSPFLLHDAKSLLATASAETRQQFARRLQAHDPLEQTLLLRLCGVQNAGAAEAAPNADSESAAMLAVLRLLDAFDRMPAAAQRTSKNVFVAFWLVGRLARAQPTDFRFAVWRLVLAQKLGLFVEALRLFERLAVKNIQLDSLGYLIADNAAALGHFGVAEALLERIFALYYANRREAGSMAAQALRKRAYDKFVDFCAFQFALENSLQWLLLEGDVVVANAVASVASHAELQAFCAMIEQKHSEKTLLSARQKQLLVDNRDRSLLSFDGAQ